MSKRGVSVFLINIHQETGKAISLEEQGKNIQKVLIRSSSKYLLRTHSVLDTVLANGVTMSRSVVAAL